jgi:hypothetical protein
LENDEQNAILRKNIAIDSRSNLSFRWLSRMVLLKIPRSFCMRSARSYIANEKRFSNVFRTCTDDSSAIWLRIEIYRLDSIQNLSIYSIQVLHYSTTIPGEYICDWIFNTRKLNQASIALLWKYVDWLIHEFWNYQSTK